MGYLSLLLSNSKVQVHANWFRETNTPEAAHGIIHGFIRNLAFLGLQTRSANIYLKLAFLRAENQQASYP